MTRFSANLGFLWTDRPLPDAIRAAKAAGFDAVECHWPYDVPSEAVAAALSETGLPLLGLNTRRGNVNAGENGLAALPGREPEARAAIDEALTYAGATNTPNIHVMAGFATGADAKAVFLDNLAYAADKAAADGKTILIEPLNHYDAPGYFLQYTGQARAIIDELGRSNVKLMFDCYHVQLMEGDLSHRIAELAPLIGHIQIASVPDRAEPDSGEVNYPHIYGVLQDVGLTAPIGAEYKPRREIEAGLGWLAANH